MRTRLSLHRRIVGGAVAGVLALAVGTLMPGAASASSSATWVKPIFMIWKPGTPLPTVPAGYKLVAWPPDSVMKTIKLHHSVPVAAMTARMARTARSYTALENSAGLVNLELVPSPDSCVPSLPQFQQDLGSASTNVMQSYSTIAGVTQNFTYGNGQSSSLGVGASPSGAAGTFSASGTASVSTDSSIGFATQSGRSFNHFETYFEQGKYYVPNSCPQLDGYITKAYQWNAGTKYVHPSGAPGATHCTPFHPGDHFTKSNTTATTFAVGFNVPIVNFSGSAQTGYTGTASITFHWTVTAQLCGVNNTPPNSPGILVAS